MIDELFQYLIDNDCSGLLCISGEKTKIFRSRNGNVIKQLPKNIIDNYQYYWGEIADTTRFHFSGHNIMKYTINFKGLDLKVWISDSKLSKTLILKFE